MQAIIAPVSDMQFDIEIALDMQLGAKPLPFPGMDKSGSAICTFHLKNICTLGGLCPYRHVRADRAVVCKHWLRGLCKKGDDCEFLHEYDMSKMPECYFFQRFGECGNKECPFLHIDPESKRKDCAWYDRGFCRHGPLCKNRHIRRVLCPNYLTGFCPKGPKCQFSHPRFGLPNTGEIPNIRRPTCNHCGEYGHVIWKCFQIPEAERAKLVEERDKKMQAMNAMRDSTAPSSLTETQTVVKEPAMLSPQRQSGQQQQPAGRREYRPLDQITCYKCGEIGHFANRCPRGHLAFLSAAKVGLDSERQ